MHHPRHTDHDKPHHRNVHKSQVQKYCTRRTCALQCTQCEGDQGTVRGDPWGPAAGWCCINHRHLSIFWSSRSVRAEYQKSQTKIKSWNRISSKIFVGKLTKIPTVYTWKSSEPQAIYYILQRSSRNLLKPASLVKGLEASQHQQCWPPTLIDRRDSWTSVFLESTSFPHSVFLIAPLPTILSTGGRVGTSPWPTWPSVIFSGRRLFPNYSFLRHILKPKSCILWRNILSTYI